MAADLVLAANNWKTNADLILDCVRLGYIKESDRVLDPTYGKGVWWRKFQPKDFVKHDLALDGVNFLTLSKRYGEEFDVVGFDPPYVSTGGRDTSTIDDFNDNYGLTDAPASPYELQHDLINPGLAQVYKVLKPRARGAHRGGIALTKVKDYTSSGKLWLGTYETIKHALSLGFEVLDKFEHVGRTGAQPLDRTKKDGTPVGQKLARHNSSTLLVLRKV